MDNENITWIDLDKGLPTITIARYGITLNSSATEIISQFEIARVGYQKDAKRLVIAMANLGDYEGKLPEGWFSVKDKITSHGYFRLNNKDLARMVARYANINLSKKNKFIAEWEESNNFLVIDLTEKIEKDSPDKKQNEIFEILDEIW